MTTTWMNDHVAEYHDAANGLEALLPEIAVLGTVLVEVLAAGGTIYTFGNGGSAADAQHLTGELIGRYKRERRPLAAVTLSTDATVMTCIGNDYTFDDVLSRQVEALARPGDAVVAFTTSGRSANVVRGLAAARAAGATTILLTGASGGPATEHADHTLRAPTTITPRIQEIHTFVLHVVSEMIDVWAAETEDDR